MSTVVGLVRSRLHGRSKRAKSVDVDIIVSEGGHLIRHKSLRQEALAEPTEDDLTVSPVRTNMSARTPNELDPYTLAVTLQNRVDRDAPPVPSIPSLPDSSYPARQSSLQNPRSYKGHRRAASQNEWPDISEDRSFRRRHNTFSSPDERPQYNTQTGYFDQIPNRPPATRTAKLFGSIAESRNRKSLDSQDEDSSSAKSFRRRSREMANTGKPIQEKPLPERPAVDGLDNLSSLKMSLPPVEPLPPIQLSQTKSKSDVPEHVRLPEGFQPGYTEDTTVEEVWQPAVEHEVIERRITEIVHPEIERDIHYDHYYQYEQPVHVTEVLPPKHYRLDAKTGVKVEIEAPAHFRMPRSLSPTRADISGVRGTHRHYLVDEAHPNGVLEDWPRQEQVWI